MYKSCLLKCFSTSFTALFCPYIAHERTAQNLDYVSWLVALFLIERHRSLNEGSLKSEEQLSDFKEPCAHLCSIHCQPLTSSFWVPGSSLLQNSCNVVHQKYNKYVVSVVNLLYNKMVNLEILSLSFK